MSLPKPNRHARRAARARRRRTVATSAAAGLLAASGAQATTYDESVGGDLPDTFPGLLLPIGTDRVEGDVCGEFDYFTFQGLAAGGDFQLDVTGSDEFTWLDDAGAVIEMKSPFGGAVTFSGEVPDTGQLHFEAFGEGSCTWAATLTLTAPDPSYDESVDGDLPGTFAGRLLLPVGTNAASGVENPFGDQDHFAFQSLAPGASFELTLAPPTTEFSTVHYRLLDDSGSMVDQAFVYMDASTFSGSVTASTFSGSVTASGLLNLAVTGSEGTAPTWAVSLDLVAADPTYDESVSGDLGETFATRTLLGRGAERAVGEINPVSDVDQLSFQGFAPGAPFTLTFDIPTCDLGGGVDYAWLDDVGTPLATQALYVNSLEPGTIEGDVPANGELQLRMAANEGTVVTWGVTLVPEPGRAGLLGAALATLTGLARLRGRRD
jgi:hypothetical protein